MGTVCFVGLLRKKYRGITLSFQKTEVKGSISPLLAEWGIAQTIPVFFKPADERLLK